MAHRLERRSPRLRAAVSLVVLGAAAAACDDNPFAFDWSDEPKTVLLYSMARPELGLVSAFNFRQEAPIRVEAASATGLWDAAVDTRSGRLVLLAPGAFGVVSTARIAVLPDTRLEDVLRAPQDTTAYIADDPVVVEDGTVYVVKTNRRSDGPFGASCVYYAKLEPVTIDAVGGTLTFRYVTNPICNSQDLVPPD